jgi:hypothetical protein
MSILGMHPRTARWLAQGVIATSIGLTLVASGLQFAAGQDNVWFTTPMLAIPIAGAVVLERRPDNRVGQLFVLLGMLLMVSNSADAWARFSVVVHELPCATWAAWFLGVGDIPLSSRMTGTLIAQIAPTARNWSIRSGVYARYSRRIASVSAPRAGAAVCW